MLYSIIPLIAWNNVGKGIKKEAVPVPTLPPGFCKINVQLPMPISGLWL